MNNLLLERLSKMEKETFTRFDYFIKSPYFHRGEKALQVFEMMRPFYSGFDLPKNVQQKIKKLFPSKIAYDVLLSRLNDSLDEFELYEQFNKKPFLKNMLRYELELEQKNNVKLYHQLQQTNNRSIHNSDDLYADYYKEFASISICENNWLSDKEKIMLHSEKAMTNILHFFLAKYLIVYANKITHSLNIFPKPELSPETQNILRYVSDTIEKQTTSIQSIFYIIQLFNHISGSREEFDHYFKKLKEGTFHLKKEDISYEIKYALIQASSACVFKCYSDPSYFQNAFEIIQFLVEKDLYFKDLHASLIEQRFILIVKIALGAHKIDWAKNLIEEKISLINKKVREDFYNYAVGLIFFHQQKYEQAVKLMVKINLNSAQFIADYKITLLKMYYELGDVSGFNYQSQTFIKFLKKDKSLNKTYKKNIADSVEFIKWHFKFKKNKKYNELSEKIKMKDLDYLINNYRDKWFSEKYNTLIKA